jgi:hypothetical protein
VGSHPVQIICSDGTNTISQVFTADLVANADPVWTAPSTAVTKTITFLDGTFSLDLSGTFTDADSDYQPVTEFLVYISTSNSDKS